MPPPITLTTCLPTFASIIVTIFLSPSGGAYEAVASEAFLHHLADQVRLPCWKLHHRGERMLNCAQELILKPARFHSFVTPSVRSLCVG